jgi:hypothetical protein
MSSTKKLLVAFDPAKPDSKTTDFLVPWSRGGQRVLLGLKSGQEAALGMVVFIGRSVTEKDLFTKLVDSGAVIANVDETLHLLRSHLARLQTLKIGNVVRIRSPAQDSGPDVDLELIAITPSAVKA